MGRTFDPQEIKETYQLTQNNDQRIQIAQQLSQRIDELNRMIQVFAQALEGTVQTFRTANDTFIQIQERIEHVGRQMIAALQESQRLNEMENELQNEFTYQQEEQLQLEIEYETDQEFLQEYEIVKRIHRPKEFVNCELVNFGHFGYKVVSFTLQTYQAKQPQIKQNIIEKISNFVQQRLSSLFQSIALSF